MMHAARTNNSECGQTCDQGFRDMTWMLTLVGLKTPKIGPAIEHDLRKFDIWHWATQPSPPALHDYQTLSHEYLRGPVPDQFSLSHAGHGANSYSLNIRLAAGNVAMHAQTGWGGAYTGAPPSTPEWLAICSVAEQLIETAANTRRSRGFVRRSWLVTFSDFRDSELVPVGAWGLEWIGEGTPPNGVPSNSSATSPDQLDALLRIIRETSEL